MLDCIVFMSWLAAPTTIPIGVEPVGIDAQSGFWLGGFFWTILFWPDQNLESAHVDMKHPEMQFVSKNLQQNSFLTMNPKMFDVIFLLA